MKKTIKDKNKNKSFLNDNLDELLLNINDTYGPILLEELRKRLEITIEEFNNEINEAFGLLKQRNDARKSMNLDSLNESDFDSSVTESEWEKKLKEIDNKSN